jgi:hypothetical protein
MKERLSKLTKMRCYIDLDGCRRHQMFIESIMDERTFDPGRGRTFSPSNIFYKHTIPPGLIAKLSESTSERSHVYRNKCTTKAFDPGWGRTFSLSNIFYKHTIPLGLIAKLPESTSERSHVYRNKCTTKASDPGRGRTFSPSNIFYKHTIPPGLILKY